MSHDEIFVCHKVLIRLAPTALKMSQAGELLDQRT
jgi:hypothetical protein